MIDVKVGDVYKSSVDKTVYMVVVHVSEYSINTVHMVIDTATVQVDHTPWVWKIWEFPGGFDKLQRNTKKAKMIRLLAL